MIEIHFQHLEDAASFYRLLKRKLQSSKSDQNILLDEDQYIVKIVTDTLTEQTFCKIKNSFYQYVLDYKCNGWFRTLITEKYLYSDEEEIQQILDITHSILEGERIELNILIKNPEEKNILKQAINQILKRTISFSFDSFIKFRLRSFLDRLEKYVELAIDEYKMELEYQMFIQTLRDFISNRSAMVNCLHLLVNDDIVFYNESFYEIKRFELTKMIDRKLLFNHPVYVDSSTIAPLLSIAPKLIYLYSAEPDQPLIRTIQNIFEERVFVEHVTVFKERRHQHFVMKKRTP